MKKASTLILRNSLLFFAIFFAFSISRAAAQTKPASAVATQATPVPARITQAIDETQLVTLKGNVHPLTRVAYDQGLLDDGTPIGRMLMLLQRSPAQEAALRQLLDDQLTKNSPNYHAWLTPEQYGAQYGPADADIQTVTQWLSSKGFQNIKVGAGRTVIEFSGNAGEVRNTFHTEIHHLLVNGEARVANMSDPQIPAALAPVVAGVVSLNNFPRRSYLHRVTKIPSTKATGEVNPMFTFSGGICGTNSSGAPNTCLGMGPADFATIYNLPSTLNRNYTSSNTLTGTGQNIAIVEESNLNIQDVQFFRSMFGLPTNNPTIILDGPDPGILGPDSTGEETEADLDVQWAGAVAPSANVFVVVSETPDTAVTAGIDLSAIYIIDNNIAPVMSESYGACEAELGNAGNAFYNALWEQASAQGITAILSAGDTGSASCDPTTSNLDVAAFGQAVSGFASTPFNVAVGGTDFYYTEAAPPQNFWSATNGGTTGTESALSYIPESTWNDSCAGSGVTTLCTASIINADSENGIDLTGGGGGPSNCMTQNSAGTCTAGYPKPAWQTGVNGMPSDSVRDVPDLSLFSSNGFNGTFYIICEIDANDIPPQTGNPDSCDLNSSNEDFLGVGGTSAAAPTFAGIMALINQNDAANGGTGRQGNANYILYQLYKNNASGVCTSNATAATATGCIFYDVVQGNNSVACAGGSPDCSNRTAGDYGILTTVAAGSTPAWDATAGYDRATGLGSVNVTNLVGKWGTAGLTATTTTINTYPTTALSHGTSATFKVTVTGSGGTPTGPVSLIVTSGSVVQGIGPFPLSGGTVTFSTPLLQGGSPDSIVARYGGDGTFAQSSSTPPVSVTVNKESSETFSTFVTFEINGQPVANNYPVTAVYGSAYILRFDVTNSSGTACSNSLNNAIGNGTTPPPPPPIDTIPCPTGQVAVTDNGAALNDYSSPNSTLPAGTTTLNSQGFFEDQPVQLSGGSHSIMATYAGDNSYTGSTSAAGGITITAAPTQVVSLVASPSSTVTTSTPVTLTATVQAPTSNGAGPAGSVVFTANGTNITGTPLNVSVGYNPSTGAPPTLTSSLTTSFSTAGTESITAQYVGTGDPNYAESAVSPAISVTVTQGTSSGSFAVSYSPASLTLSSSTGASQSTTVTVTPSGGFTGTVAVTPSTATAGVTCTPSPLDINVTGTTAVMGQLSCSVLETSSTLSSSNTPQDRVLEAGTPTPSTAGSKGWWTLSAGTGFAALFLLFLPGERKRYHAALGLGLVCILSFALGCGGGSTTPPPPTLTPTVTKMTVTSAKVASGTAFSFSVTVTGGTPTGQVGLYDNGTAIGTPASVSGGTAAPTAPALSVGTHQISAHYLGDSTTAASQSGTLNMTVTGSTTLAITTIPAATPAAPALTVTIQ
jgi:Pro-kumamolisin, activation domain/Bacterial Ig-like domain (group 3)